MARSRSIALDTLTRPDASARSRSFAIRFGVAFAALAIVLTGCDSGTQEPDAPAPEAVEYTAPEPGETPEAASNAAAAGSTEPGELPEGFRAELPENFPTGVPMPPGARTVLGRGGSGEGLEHTGVQLATSQAPADVLSYYTSEFEAGGWEVDTGLDNAITANMGDDKQVILYVVPDPSGGSTVYMITEEGNIAR